MRLLYIIFILLISQLYTGCAQSVNNDSDAAIEIKVVKIPMADGILLEADLYVPANMKAGDNLPVLLEYLPYRKNESRGGSYPVYSYFIERGYVVARVDIRGTGRSEGHVIPYEYSDIELDDGAVVIDWLSKQNWSNGNVGMFGISWGGFNSIQLASREVPALKAFIAFMATEDLYREDVHYIDGIIHMDSWMMSHDLKRSLPGAPDFKLDEDWLENRFNAVPSIFTYMKNQRENAFWDRASSLDKYDQITVPGFYIGGWYDGYRNAVPRLLENANAPSKAMIGPWDHEFPHNASHSPQMEWRYEAVRWFDHWLKGEDNGIMDEPRFAVYMRDWHPPGPGVFDFPGRWQFEDGWPIERTGEKTFYATADHGLSEKPSTEDIHHVEFKPSVGLEGGGPVMWWGSVTPDQQPMDDYALNYESDAIDDSFEILGFPRTLINVAAGAPQANWVVRLSDVAPDGSVTQVGGAAINGTHRNSAREPEYLTPGEFYPLDIKMHFTSWKFNQGHKIRFSITNSMWPMLWPTPDAMTTSLKIGETDGARVILPILPSADRPTPDFKVPEISPTLSGFGALDSGNSTGYAEIKTIERDEKTGDAFGVASNATSYQFPWGKEHFEESIEHRTSDKNPAHTSVIGKYALTEELEDRTIRMEQEVEFKSDENNFYLTFKRVVKLNGELLKEKTWQETFPRDFQ